MNIIKEDNGPLSATIKIQISREDYEEKVARTLKEQQRKAAMPGFRPGKVPFGMIKKMFGKSLLLDEINHLLSENLHKYIEENKLNIIGNPLPNKEKSPEIDLDNQADFEFCFDIGLAPEIAPPFDPGLGIEYFDIKANNKMVDNYVHDMQHRLGGHSNPEEADKEDLVQGELAEIGTDGNLKENGIKHKTTVSIASFKDNSVKNAFTGIKKDGKVRFNPLKATGNADEAAFMLGIKKEEAEKIDAEFEFSVIEITRQEEAAIDENFFNQIFPGQEVKDEATFREKIRQSLEKTLTRESDQYFFNQVVEKLVDETVMSLPDEFIHKWLKEGVEEPLTDEQLETKYENITKSLRWQLIESHILSNYDIKVEEHEMRNVVREYFTGQMLVTNEDPEKEERLNKIIDSVLSNKEEAGKIHDQLYEKKLLEVFKTVIQPKHKEIDYDDFINLITKKEK